MMEWPRNQRGVKVRSQRARRAPKGRKMRNPTPHSTPCAMTFFWIVVSGSETELEPDDELVEPEKVFVRSRDNTPESV